MQWFTVIYSSGKSSYDRVTRLLSCAHAPGGGIIGQANDKRLLVRLVSQRRARSACIKMSRLRCTIDNQKRSDTKPYETPNENPLIGPWGIPTPGYSPKDPAWSWIKSDGGFYPTSFKRRARCHPGNYLLIRLDLKPSNLPEQSRVNFSGRSSRTVIEVDSAPFPSASLFVGIICLLISLEETRALTIRIINVFYPSLVSE